MRVLSHATLKTFWETHPDAQGALLSWYREAKAAVWNTTQDIKDRYASASFLPDRLVVFNIGGNKYRLVVRVQFQAKIVLIRFVGTHQEYDVQNKKGWL